MTTMAFIKESVRKNRAGQERTYYSWVESVWENGQSRQRHLSYIGTNPNARQVPLKPTQVVAVARLVASSPTDLQLVHGLKGIGITAQGAVKRVSLIYTPHDRKVALRFQYDSTD